jgi:hypothetical protein
LAKNAPLVTGRCDSTVHDVRQCLDSTALAADLVAAIGTP